MGLAREPGGNAQRPCASCAVQSDIGLHWAVVKETIFLSLLQDSLTVSIQLYLPRIHNAKHLKSEASKANHIWNDATNQNVTIKSISLRGPNH